MEGLWALVISFLSTIAGAQDVPTQSLLTVVGLAAFIKSVAIPLLKRLLPAIVDGWKTPMAAAIAGAVVGVIAHAIAGNSAPPQLAQAVLQGIVAGLLAVGINIGIQAVKPTTRETV